MVIACSYELSLIDNKEKVREKRKGILQNVKKNLNDSTALHKSQVFQRFHHGNVSIYNHREDAEKPVRGSKTKISLNFLFEKFLSKNVLGKKNCLYKGFIKPSRSHQLLKFT